MKKIFAILISLLFVASVFGIVSITADVDIATATPDVVKVGDLITVTINFYHCSDPDIIADGNKSKGDAVLVSRSHTGTCKGLDLNGVETRTWIYRATAPGTIIFDFSAELGESNGYTRVSNPVTITSNSLPMLNFMKILGFGNESA